MAAIVSLPEQQFRRVNPLKEVSVHSAVIYLAHLDKQRKTSLLKIRAQEIKAALSRRNVIVVTEKTWSRQFKSNKVFLLFVDLPELRKTF